MSIKTHETPLNWTPLPRYIFRKKNILHEIKKLKDINTFIDFGCGAGDLACSLAELGLKGKGYDFSINAIRVSNSIKKQKQLKDSQIIFSRSQTDLGEVAEEADLVLCLEVLEHIEKDRQSFEQLVRIAKKYIIISVPAKRRLYSTSDKLAGHYRRYDRKDLNKLIEHDSLEVGKVICYGYPFTNLVRLWRERQSKVAQRKSSLENMEEKSKESGIHIFNVSPKIKNLRLELILTPLYLISRLFNGTNLSEGYLVIAKKK